MNHFMLPVDKSKQGKSAHPSARYGAHVMELQYQLTLAGMQHNIGAF